MKQSGSGIDISRRFFAGLSLVAAVLLFGSSVAVADHDSAPPPPMQEAPPPMQEAPPPMQEAPPPPATENQDPPMMGKAPPGDMPGDDDDYQVPPGDDDDGYQPPGRDGDDRRMPGDDDDYQVPPGDDDDGYQPPGRDGDDRQVPPGDDDDGYQPPGRDGDDRRMPGDDDDYQVPPDDDDDGYQPPGRDGDDRRMPGDDDWQRPSDDEMFGGFFGPGPGPGPGGQGDWDDDGWVPPVGDDDGWLPPMDDGEEFDRGQMFKAFGFDDDAPTFGPGDDDHRGFMQWDDESGFEGPEGGLNQFFMAGPDGVPDDDVPGPMPGGAKEFFFSAMPGMDDEYDGPLSDDEMFGGFFGPGPVGQGDWDDDGWVPPVGDDDGWLPPMDDGEEFDRGQMFKAFGFDDDAPTFGPGDDDHRGFMQWDDESGFEGPEGGLNQFFMAGPDGVPDDDVPGPMPGGAKEFFFSAMPGMDDEYDGPLSDDEMFGGFFGPGPVGQGDWDDDGWVPPVGDDDGWLPPMDDGEEFDRGQMFKAFGFDDDAPTFGPGDDDHRGFMQWDDESGFEGPEGGLNQFFMAGPDGVPDDDVPGPMPGGAKEFFFSAMPGMDDEYDGPLSDDEMFGGFFGPGPVGQGDWDDDGWVPPVGDDDGWLPPMDDGEEFDRGQMFKAFGFDDDAPTFGPGDDDHRGFMQWDDESGFEGPEGGLNQFFMAGPDGVPDDDVPGPMPGGAKEFFFKTEPVSDSIEEADDSESELGNSPQIQAPAQKQDFFNPGETDTPAEEEVPKNGFFKPEAGPKEESEPPAAAFFANSATSSPSANSAPRPSFFNPGGVSNLFAGGSSKNEVREDSELTRGDDRQFESSNDSDGQAQSRDDRNDEDRAEAP